MKKLRLLLIAMISIFLINSSKGQDLISSGGTIKGRVIDNETSNDLEYVTIAVFKANSNTLVNGTITDSKGDFILKDISKGVYYVVVDFMGYDKQQIDALKITDSEKNAVINVYLKRSVNELEGVEINADKNVVDYKIDRKIVNVSKNLGATGGSAVDALQNVPSVQTDIEGNVTLRGSSSFTVLIDGKPTVLEPSDALQQIPASLIENIEIITNPSAKYDPNGTAGIINVITKKAQAKGMSGLVNASVGTGLSYSGNVYIKYNMPKFTVSGGIDYNMRVFNMTGNSERYTYMPGITQSLITETDGGRDMERMGANIGFEYYLTKNNTFSMDGKYRNMNMDRSQLSLNSFQSDLTAPWEYYLTDDKNLINPESYSINLTDIHNFGKKGHELKTSFFLSTDKMKKNETVFQYNSDENYFKGEQIEDATLITDEDELEYKFESDYTIPVRTNGLIEAGFHWSFSGSNSTFNSQYIFPDTENINESDNTNFSRTIYAGYGTYSDKIGNLEYKLGLRAEYTDRILEQFSMENDFVYTHFDLYPSAYITYNFKNKDQFQLNYSKRLNRPRGFSLNPYVLYSDGFSLMKGNPDLEPEYAHVAELNYIKKFKNSFISLETFFRQTNNKMTRLGELNDEGILVYTFANLDSDRSIGGEAMFNLQLFKWWTLNVNASIYQYQVIGEYDNTDQKKISTNWDSRGMSMFKLGKSTSIQLNSMYSGPSITIDGTREGMFFVGAAVKQEFMKRKLSLSLNVQDIFNTGKRESTTSTESYYIHSLMARQAPIFNLQISYKINTLKNIREANRSEDGGYDMYMQ